MCSLAKVSRASYYRDWAKTAPAEADVDLRNEIQKIYLSHRRYGYRRVGAELRRRGRVVNHKKIRRLMREDNLLAVRRRKFVTVDSKNALAVFPNLAPYMWPDGPDQGWVSDITYIRLRHEFVYLAVVLDAFSRRVVGWALDRHFQVSLPLRALQQAIATRHPPSGLVHHSDRGVQYASEAYVAVLFKHLIIGSMSRKGYPYDNAFCESFMRTLKEEEIYCSTYSDIDDLRKNLTYFLEVYYPLKRLHSALGYRTPAEFEAGFLNPNWGS